jgi:hypothetical protein
VHHRLLRRPQPLSQEGRQRHRFMGSTCCGASTPQRAMIEDSTVEFLTMSSGEGSFGNFSSSRHSSGASLAPASTTTWKENAPAMMKFPLWMAVLRSETNFPLKWCYAHQEGQQAQAHARHPPTEMGSTP